MSRMALVSGSFASGLFLTSFPAGTFAQALIHPAELVVGFGSSLWPSPLPRTVEIKCQYLRSASWQTPKLSLASCPSLAIINQWIDGARILNGRHGYLCLRMGQSLTLPVSSNTGVGSVIFQLDNGIFSPSLPRNFAIRIYDAGGSAILNQISYTMSESPSRGIIALPFFKPGNAQYFLKVFENGTLQMSQAIPNGTFADIATVPAPVAAMHAYKAPQQMLVQYLASGVAPTGTNPLPNISGQYLIAQTGTSAPPIALIMFLNQNSSKYTGSVDYEVACTSPDPSTTYCHYDMSLQTGSAAATSSFYTYLEQPVLKFVVPKFLYK